MQNLYVQPSELPIYSDTFERIHSPKILRLLISFLKKIAFLLGFPVYIKLTPETVEHYQNPEHLRALRITKRLYKAGYIEHSRYLTNSRPDEPMSYVLIHNLSHDYGLGWAGKSAHLSDKGVILWPALGEAIERYSLQHSYCKAEDLVQSSFKALHKPKVDIFKLAGFSDSERKTSTAPYRFEFTQDDMFIWVPVNRMGFKERFYAPWQWFSFSHLNSATRKKGLNEPLLTPPISTGAAAGQTVEKAILAGLLEVIERDAFMIYWLQQVQAKKIDLNKIKNDEIQNLMQLAVDYRLELHMLYLQTDVPVHTISLVIVDRSGIGPAVNVSAKTGFDIVQMIVDLMQDMLAHRGLSYELSNGFPDMVDVAASELTHVSRMLYWHNPKQIPDIEHFLAGDPCILDDLPVYETESTTLDHLAHLCIWFAKKDYPVYYREIISPKLKELSEGVSVVVVKVPDMQPLYLEEQLKATGGARLQAVPKELGLSTWYEKHGEYYKVPHPFP